MNGFDKMNKKLLASQVEDALMDDILNKPVPIGEKIPNEYELAEMYGVGRSTIRETVKSLVSKGILEVRQGSGTYVIGTDTLENDPLGFSKYEDKYKPASVTVIWFLSRRFFIAILTLDFLKPSSLDISTARTTGSFLLRINMVSR